MPRNINRDLISYRSEFSSLNDCHYLISNSLGAMPDKARESASRYTEVWRKRGVRAWEDEWWMLAREVGDEIASLIGAAPDTISMQPNVTTAEEVIISTLNLTPERNKIVMVDMEFPSMLYLYRKRLEGIADIVIVESEDGISIPIEKALEQIDERTALVPISHVLFRSSYIVDAKQIVEKAHDVGARVALDVFQSIGVLPVNLTDLNVDLAVGGMLKWMCGGPGACFLYVRPDLINALEPRFTGWLAHENPFAFDRHAMRYTTGSYRYNTGTPVIPALYTCRAGMEIIRNVGVERIRKRSMEMTKLLISLADERGWKTTVSRDPEKRAGTVALDVEHGVGVATELNARNFLVDYRPRAGIRVSPHFYNTDTELEDVIGEIEEILQSGAHSKHIGNQRAVT